MRWTSCGRLNASAFTLLWTTTGGCVGGACMVAGASLKHESHEALQPLACAGQAAVLWMLWLARRFGQRWAVAWTVPGSRGESKARATRSLTPPCLYRTTCGRLDALACTQRDRIKPHGACHSLGAQQIFTQQVFLSRLSYSAKLL